MEKFARRFGSVDAERDGGRRRSINPRPGGDGFNKSGYYESGEYYGGLNLRLILYLRSGF